MSRSTLEAARRGDELAFAALTAPYLVELRVHCYRMLGSLFDAEDLVQETMAAAWQGLDGFAGRSSLRAWLYRIATNRCLNAIRDAKRRRPPEPVPPFDPPEPSRRGEVTWLQPYPDAWLEQVADPTPGPLARYEAHEAVELAFIAALQRLPPRQTAAVVLCEVLGFTTGEVAAMLDTTTTAVKGALQRARATLASDSGVARRAGKHADHHVQERALARRFAEAFSTDDIDGVVALLSDDAWLAMPPAPHEYHGPAAIAGFLHASARWRGHRHLRLIPTWANTQPAFGCYLPDLGGGRARAAGILVLATTRDRVTGIDRFLDDRLHTHFGLPDSLEC